ncbi:MAG: type I-MYXAN CRISPR-associated protein Cas6/Cmx6 [Gallionella sp.]|nr:type I-MYXAN CRISPR-associated protein Cas6/Cmx6 [Gallionella sp.]
MTEMIDAVFDIRGDRLPAAYPFALWDELARRVPQLGADASVGVLPLRISGKGQEVLLPKRSKLVLRLPVALAGHAAALVEAQLDVEGNELQLGEMKLREIQPYPTIHAHLVTGADDETEFINALAERLGPLGVSGKWICGRRSSLIGPERAVHGYSLVLHDLKPDDSLYLQYTGLGTDRHLGCGIFVPYKVITGLD